MLILNPIRIAPFAAGSASTASAVREWQREAGRAIAESDKAAASMGRARRGAGEVASEAAGVRHNTNATRQGVNAARPIAEANLAWRAAGNSPGVSAVIGQAERNAFDPRSPTPSPNMGAPENQVRGPANAIAGGGREVSRRSGGADDLERRI